LSVWEEVPAGLWPPQFQARLRFLRARLQPGERVLDVGCGEGHFAVALLDAGMQVLAADIAEEPLRRARALRPELEVCLLPAPSSAAGPWPLGDAEFDAVWAGETIEHVADTVAWLSEVRRVLRPHGQLLLSTPAHGPLRMLALALSRRAFATHFDPRADHLRFYSRSTLAALLQDFRFINIQLHELGGPPGARRTLLAAARRARW
jgi:2-polyprenyl-3-methyl-5-hydroxy-6-metoxy-1,4-benzoquinol methylase